MKIRKAQESDFDDLISMSLEVHSIHLENRPDEFKALSADDIRSSLSKVLNDDNQDILVCMDNEKLVGYILSRAEYRKENPVQKARHYLYIDQIGVKREYRRSGVGGLLIKSVRELAKERGIDLMLIDVWNFNEGAMFFFSSQGFLPWIQRMGMTVD